MPKNNEIIDAEQTKEDGVGALNGIIAFLWLALFGGRWLILPFITTSSPETVRAFAVLDNRVLLPCYLLLLTITLIILGLRVARRAAPAGHSSASNMPIHAEELPAVGEASAPSSGRRVNIRD